MILTSTIPGPTHANRATRLTETSLQALPPNPPDMAQPRRDQPTFLVIPCPQERIAAVIFDAIEEFESFSPGRLDLSKRRNAEQVHRFTVSLSSQGFGFVLARTRTGVSRWRWEIRAACTVTNA